MRYVSSYPRAIREIMTEWIPMPDGCRLAARIWLPVDAEDDPVPAVLEYLPYRRRDGTASGMRSRSPISPGMATRRFASTFVARAIPLA